MAERRFLGQRNWTKSELLELGFRYYRRPKRVTMVRELPQSEAPLFIGTLVAEAGYMICFEAGHLVRAKLYDYPHRPVRPDHFEALYQLWDEPDWQPTLPEKHLMSLGCDPYYNNGGVWARKLEQDTEVQSTESPRPAIVPAGDWLLIGAKGAAWGAPYSCDEETFFSVYDSAPHHLNAPEITGRL